jgi:hypothetical protein
VIAGVESIVGQPVPNSANIPYSSATKLNGTLAPGSAPALHLVAVSDTPYPKAETFFDRRAQHVAASCDRGS